MKEGVQHFALVSEAVGLGERKLLFRGGVVETVLGGFELGHVDYAIL